MEIKNVHCEKQALELFRMMPDDKKSALHNALSRNLEFTTSWGWNLANSVLMRTVFTSLSKVPAAAFPCMQSW